MQFLLHFKENQKIEYGMCDKTFDVGYGYLMQMLPALTHINAYTAGICIWGMPAMFVYCNRCVHVCLFCAIQFHNCYLKHHSISTTQLKLHVSFSTQHKTYKSFIVIALLNDSIAIRCYWHFLKFNGS